MNFDGKISASVDVTNTGIMTVKKSFNCIQEIWLICHQTFKRVKRISENYIEKEKKTVTFEISIEDLKFYNSD
jgi:beta-glucosidase